ncbi:MAG: S41 family peptidase [Candidatus Promineifilaceae bacterium]
MFHRSSTFKELIPLVAVSVIWFVMGWMASNARYFQQQTLADVGLSRLRNHLWYTETNPARVDIEAIRGAIDALNDPYTDLIGQPATARLLADFAGEVGIVGIKMKKQGADLFVTQLVKEGPAEQQGVQVGDKIISIDQIMVDASLSEVDAYLLVRGPLNEPAQLVVLRGDQTLHFSIDRQQIPLVEYELLEDQIAYVRQYSFRTESVALIEQALLDAQRQNAKAVIWDLRQNSGGSMDAAQQILSFFVEEGLLFQAELPSGMRREFEATGNHLTSMQLIVLTSEMTVSAAETAAAVVKTLHAGTVIGETTYGKGTIQTSEPLIDGYALHYTVAKWLDSNGEWYQDVGVAPDIEIADDQSTDEDEMLEFALNYLSEDRD